MYICMYVYAVALYLSVYVLVPHHNSYVAHAALYNNFMHLFMISFYALANVYAATHKHTHTHTDIYIHTKQVKAIRGY